VNKVSFILLIIPLVLFTSCTTEPEDDDDWDAAKVCPETGTNAYGMPNRGTFTDERDGQVYKYTTIGDQVWMAENLNYDALYSYCDDIFADSCKTFGRFYCFFEKCDMDLKKLDTSLLKSTCPLGWHIPSKDEWEELFKIMGEKAAERLKGKDYWGYERKEGKDYCTFDALPSGHFGYSGVYSYFRFTSFASSTITSDNEHVAIFFQSDISFGTDELKMSVRCVKD